MKTATMSTNRRYSRFMELTPPPHYVKRVEIGKEPSILNNIKAGLEEVRMFKEGNLETTSAKDFLDEL